MKVWMPYISTGSGTDSFTVTLAEGLSSRGHDVIKKKYPHWLQYFPWLLKTLSPPSSCDVIITNSWNGFAFARQEIPLLSIEHLFVLDPEFRPYKSFLQSCFHDHVIKRFEALTRKRADQLIAVSEYTANTYHQYFEGKRPTVVHNGVDTQFFQPSDKQNAEDGIHRLLFAGNLSKRKGADLLPEIMDKLGPDFELMYTAGNRPFHFSYHPKNMICVGKLDREGMRYHYQTADLLILPTRLEGFPLVALEAMACGTPVISHACSSLPELIENKVNGILCPIEQVDCMVENIRTLCMNRESLKEMSNRAIRTVTNRFLKEQWISQYSEIIEQTIENNH